MDTTKPTIRWVILFLSCWLLFGNYYAFDNPSALNRQMMHWLGSDYDTYQYQLNLLYSVYSFPNIILPLFAGNLMDRYGTHRLLLLFSFLVLIGQGFVAIGVQWKSFGVMLLGRVIFGLGGESLTVAQARLVTEWFRGKELALAIGLNLSVARFGTVFNNNLSPIFADKISIPFAVWIGFISCAWSFVCSIFTVIIDIKCHGHHKKQSLDHPFIDNPNTNRFAPLELIKNTLYIISTYHPAFWLVCIVCFTYYGALVPFNNIASDLLRRKWYGDDTFKTGLVMSIPDTVAIFLVPIIGSFVDRFGHKVTIMTIGGMLMTIGHFIIGTTTIEPIFPLCFNGIANSTLLVLWPCIPLLVEEIYWASAYGILTMCINASYTFIPFGVAALTTMDPTYYAVEMYFVILTFFGTFTSVVLARSDKRLSLGLNTSERETMASGGWKQTEEFGSLMDDDGPMNHKCAIQDIEIIEFPEAPYPSVIPSFAPPLEPLLVVHHPPRLDRYGDVMHDTRPINRRRATTTSKNDRYNRHAVSESNVLNHIDTNRAIHNQSYPISMEAHDSNRRPRVNTLSSPMRYDDQILSRSSDSIIDEKFISSIK